MVCLSHPIHAPSFVYWQSHKNILLEEISENFLLFFYSSKLAFDFFETLQSSFCNSNITFFSRLFFSQNVQNLNIP